MDNPYLGLYEVMKNATKVEPSFFIAKIKTPLPNLEVQLNDIVLDKDDLLIDKWLLDRNEDLFTEYVDAHSHTSNAVDAHTHTIYENNRHRHEIKEPIHNKLEKDDRVVLLNINDKFIIISKVVNI